MLSLRVRVLHVLLLLCVARFGLGLYIITRIYATCFQSAQLCVTWHHGNLSIWCAINRVHTPTFQEPLIKESTLNHIREPFLEFKAYSLFKGSIILVIFLEFEVYSLIEGFWKFWVIGAAQGSCHDLFYSCLDSGALSRRVQVLNSESYTFSNRYLHELLLSETSVPSDWVLWTRTVCFAVLVPKGRLYSWQVSE